MAKTVLVFNKNKGERILLSGMLKAQNCSVFETPHALEALKMLQKEDIGVVLASRDIEGMKDAEFEALVNKVKPGVSTVMLPPFSEKDRDFSINPKKFVKLIRDYIEAKDSRQREGTNLKRFFASLVDRLLQIFEVNDRYFFNNDHFVAELSQKIAMKMGLEENLVEAIQMAALLRDLGMVGIHHQILEGSKRLSSSEMTPIREHPLHTIQILGQVRFPWNLDSIISQHHERYGGSGYPEGLKGRQIAIGARIIAVADAFYAMTTDRPYRRALSRERAIQEITKNAGSQFDPEVVEVFLSAMKEAPSNVSPKANILIFEREPNVAALVKLSTNADEFDVAHVTNSIEAIGYIRQKNPHLIIANVDTLDADAFVRFYNTAQQVSVSGIQRFLLIVPDRDYLKHFNGSVEYVSQPLTIWELRSKIKRLLSEAQLLPQQEESRGLTGALEEFSLADLVQILSLGLKTAKVEVMKGEDKGTLYLLHGKVVHASVRDLKGPEAFYEIIGWDAGRFHIMHGQFTSDINVTIDTMRMLFEADSVLNKKEARKTSA